MINSWSIPHFKVFFKPQWIFIFLTPLTPIMGGHKVKPFLFSKSTLYYTQMKGMTQEIIFMELSSSSNLILAGFNCIITILPLPAYRIWNLHIFFCYRLLLFVLTALYMIGYISNENLDSLAIKTEVKARFSFLALICYKDAGAPVWGGSWGEAKL